MFIKKHFLKIASVLLAVITIAVFSGFAANAERIFPHNPISEDSKTDLEPEIIITKIPEISFPKVKTEIRKIQTEGEIPPAKAVKIQTGTIFRTT